MIVDTPMVWIPHDRSTVQLLHMQRNVDDESRQTT